MNYSSYSDKIIKANEADNHEDTIQVIETDKNGKGIFVTGGWDGEVKVWQLNDTSTSSISNTKVDLKMKYSFNEMVLSLGLSNDSVLFIGLSNGELKYIQFNNQSQLVNLDTFSSAILYIKWVSNIHMFIVFGADNCMRCYMKQNNVFNKVGQLTLPQRTCCVDIQYPYMAICSLYKYRIFRIDNDNLSKNDYSRYFDTPFEPKTKITSCALASQSQGTLFLGSFDSYIAYIRFDAHTNIIANQSGTSLLASRPYGTSKTILTQVNVMKYITLSNSISSLLIGNDKKLTIYSPQNHCEIKNYKTKGSNQITSLNFLNFNGKTYLISGIGNDWAEGINSLSKQRKSQLQIREIKDSDLKRY